MGPGGASIEDAVRPAIGTGSTNVHLPLNSSSTFNALDVGRFPPSEARVPPSHSNSEIRDFGDSKQLSEYQPPNSAVEDISKVNGVIEERDDLSSTHSVNHDGPNRDEIVSHIGGHFPDSLSQHQALREQDLRDRNTNARHTCHTAATSEEVTLEEALRAALCKCPNSKEVFVPFDALNNIITKNHVSSELSKALPEATKSDIEDYAQAIMSRKTIPPPGPTVIPTSSPTFTTRRKLFAILALLGKMSAIVDFISEDLYDNILPLEIINKTEGRPFLYYRPVKGGDLVCLGFDRFWGAAAREQFEQYQWRFLAPYFDVCKDEWKSKVHHYDLPDGTILPFLEKDQYLRGGYSDVWRVIIHPAHHNHPSKQEKTSFAMKRLRDGTDESVFKAEVSNLKRFNSQRFPHLIKLYLTFRLGQYYYLLFPWADGNLLQFMKTIYPDPETPCRDRDLAVWFMGECCGAAEALRMIHTFPTSEQPGVLSTPQAKHGVHGDLKPENILFFLDHEPREGLHGLKMAVLKICDFGLMQWHKSSSVDACRAKAISRTYRAPEWDDGKQLVSQSYDIWALGCILLEFCAWYLGGWEEVDQFTSRRVGGDPGDDSLDGDFIREDAFFDFARLGTVGPEPDICVKAKKAVYEEFDSLLNLRHCTDFMIRLLTLIKDHLLRINSRNRKSCAYICDELKKIYDACIADEGFCTERVTVGPIRVRSDMSEAYPFRPSPARKNQIQKEHPLPRHIGPVSGDGVEPLDHDSESPGFSHFSGEARDSIFVLTEEDNAAGTLVESDHDKGEHLTSVAERAGPDQSPGAKSNLAILTDSQAQQLRGPMSENENDGTSHSRGSQPTSPSGVIAEGHFSEGFRNERQTEETETQDNEAHPTNTSTLHVPQDAPSQRSGLSGKSEKGSRGASSITATNGSEGNRDPDAGPSSVPPGDPESNSDGSNPKRYFRTILGCLYCFSWKV